MGTRGPAIRPPNARELRSAADDMVSQLRPRSMLRDAVDLLRKFERDENFREYVVGRAWYAIGVVSAFFLVSSVCSIDLMFRIASGSGFLLKLLALVVGAVTWLGGLVAQTYVFLVWLEERAAQLHREEEGIQVKVPHGFLAYLKYSRALPPWILVVLCVILPLAAMAQHAPVTALILAVLAAGAPAVFKMLDRPGD